MSYKIPESVLVVIYTPNLDILLIERADYPNFWQSVTGSRELNEKLEETALREVFEETGLNHKQYQDMFKLKNCHFQTTYEIYPQFRYKYAPDITHNTEHLFILEIPNDLKSSVKICPTEHTAWQWFSLHDAIQKVHSPSNREALIHLQSYIHLD